MSRTRSRCSSAGLPGAVSGRSGPRAEGEELGPVITQPITLLTPVRAMSLDERPELPRVVRDAQVAELVHDDVVQHLGRCEHEPPVEGDRPAPRARAPEGALPSDSDPAVLDADALRLRARQSRNERARARTRPRLTDRRWVEAESRHLATPLILDPRALLLEQALDAGTTRSLWHGEPRRLAPRHLQSPSPRPRRPPHLHSLHGGRG